MPADQEQRAPCLVLVTRADHEPAVPSRVVTCSMCGSDCWLSKKTGHETVALAEHLGGGTAQIVCMVCLESLV